MLTIRNDNVRVADSYTYDGNVAQSHPTRESSSEAFRSGSDLKERSDKLRLSLCTIPGNT